MRWSTIVLRRALLRGRGVNAPRGKSALVLALIGSSLALAGCQQPEGQSGPTEARPPGSPPGAPGDAGDGDWIRLSGTVVSALPGLFTLDYGPGNIAVEMDDRSPLYREGSMIRSGDHAIVTGRIDDDLYLEKKIEAASVFVKEANALFHADPADEENPLSSPPGPGAGETYVDLVGRVSEVDGRQFTLDTGRRSIIVDTAGLQPDAPGAERRQTVREGDRVYVWGDLELSRADRTRIAAKGITTIR